MTINLLHNIALIGLVSIIVCLNFGKIINIVNLYDYPDNFRKIHKKKIALAGGSILVIYSLSYFILHFFFKNIQNELLDMFFFIFLLLFFLVGFVNDKKNITPILRLFLLSVICFILIQLDHDLKITKLYFESLDKTLYFHSYSVFFTILCFLLFLNALNMADGINLQSISFCFFFLVILFLKCNSFFLIYLLMSLFILAIFNYKNLTFLGDNGVYILAFVIGYYVIKNYNILNSISPEEIFILMSIPGLDMLRLFLIRIINKKNPFAPDRNHIHHLLLAKFGYIKTIFFLFFLNSLPYFFYYFSKNFIIIPFILFFYLILIFNLRHFVKK